MSYGQYDDEDTAEEGAVRHGGHSLSYRRTEMLRDLIHDRKERGVQMVGKFASVLTSREVKAHLVPNSGVPAPAWSTSNTIGFDEDKLKDLGTIDGLLSFKGLSVHEVSHILFSPRSGSDIAQWVREKDMNEAFQVLEEQRIETLMVGRFGGSVVPWLTSAIANYLLDNPDGFPTAYTLLRGRRYLPVEVRAMMRDAFENQDDLDELCRIVDEYRLLLFPADTDRAKELVAQMHDVLSRLSKPPQSSCGQKDADTFESSGDSRPLSPREQRAARDNAKSAKGEKDDKQESERKQQQQSSGKGKDEKDPKDQGDKSKSSKSKSDKSESDEEQTEQSNGGASDKDEQPKDEQDGDSQDGDSQDDGEQDGQRNGQSGGAGDGDDGDDDWDDDLDGDEGDGDADSDADGEGDGEGSGDGDSSGDGPGSESDQDGGEGDHQGEGSPTAGSGESEQEAEQNTTPKAPTDKELRDALRAAVNGAKDQLRESLDRDLREVNGELELMSNDAAEPKKSDWSLIPADAITMRATKAFGNELERLRADNEPGWERVTPSGRINPSRYLRGAELDEAFDRWTIGREDATDIEAVVMLDVSSSMNYHNRATNASNAAWGIKRALDRVNARCTVVTYNGGAPQMLYKPMETATTQVKRVQPSGGTDPTLSIKYATKTLAESDRAIKILFSVTDGEWGIKEEADRQIKTLRQAGVLTAIAMIAEQDQDLKDIGAHNHEIVAQVKTSADLFILGRHLVTVATARNLARP